MPTINATPVSLAALAEQVATLMQADGYPFVRANLNGADFISPASVRSNLGLGSLAVLSNLAGLDLSSALARAAGSTADRMMSVRLGARKNPLDFGATGDGVADDTLGLEAAIAAVGAGGGVVELPPGYIFTTRRRLLLKSGTTLLGHGAVLKSRPLADWGGGPYQILSNENNGALALTDQDIAVDGLTIDHRPLVGSAGGTNHCMWFRMVKNATARGVTFLGGGSSYAMRACDDTLADGCTAREFTNCAYDHWDQPRSAAVIGCYAESVGTAQLVNFNPEQTSGSSAGFLAQGFLMLGCHMVALSVSDREPIQIEPLGTDTLMKDAVIIGNRLKNASIVMRHNSEGGIIALNSFRDNLGTSEVINVIPNGAPTGPSDIKVALNTINGVATASANGGVIRVQTDQAIVALNTVKNRTGTGPAFYYGATSPKTLENWEW